MNIGVLSMTNATTKLLIVDGQKLVTELITSALNARGDFLVSSAHSVESTLDILKTSHADKFDVILLETELCKLVAINEIEQIAKLSSPAKLVLFSKHADKNFVESCVQVGAFGFVPKTLSLEAFTCVLKFITAGQVFIPAELYSRQSSFAQDGNEFLKPCEMDVLEKLSIGMSNKEITRSLNLTESTVKLRVRSLCKKLGAANRTQALVLAQRQGFLS